MVANELRFDGRTAIVTGAGRGLGREYALELASRGARVVVNDLPDDGAAAQVVDEITAAGGAAVVDENAAGSREAASATVRSALEHFGSLDIVVTNAAVPTQSAIEDTLGVDVLGAFNLIEAAWPHFKERRYGRIVVTTSPVGLFGYPVESNRNPYATAKTAMLGLSRNLAATGRAFGIHSNVIAPWGSTRRMNSAPPGELTWMRKHFAPGMVAPAVAWLCHEECNVSGEVFSAAGGRVARIFLAEGPGFASSNLSAEMLRDNVDAVMTEAGYAIPTDSDDEFALILSRLDLTPGVD